MAKTANPLSTLLADEYWSLPHPTKEALTMHSDLPARIYVRPSPLAEHRAIAAAEKQAMVIDGDHYLRYAGWLDRATVEVLRQAIEAHRSGTKSAPLN